MAQINEIINRVVTEGVVRGMDKLASDLMSAAKAQQALAMAADGAAVATDRQATRLGSVAAQIDKARGSLDRSYRAQQQYTREVEKMTRLHTLAGSSADELAADLARIDAKYGATARAAMTAAKSIEQAGHAMQAAAARTQAGINDAFGVDVIGRSARESAAVFEQQLGEMERAAAESARRINVSMSGMSLDAVRSERRQIVEPNFAVLGQSSAIPFGAMAQGAAQAREQVKLTSGEMSNLGFQINDIATQLAMGQSPFMVMASQAGQITQILGPTGGIRAAFAAFGTAMVATLTNPITLAVLGVGALATAAMSYFSTAEDGAKKSNEQIDRHRKLIEDLKTAYGDAATAALGYGDIAREVLQFNAGANAASAADQLKVEAEKFLEAVQGLYAAGDADFRTNYNRNAGAIRAFMASVKDGTPDVDGLRNNLVRLGETQPALSRALDGIASSLYNVADATREAVRSLNLSRFDPALLAREAARGENYENLNRVYSGPLDPIGVPPAPDVRPRANPTRDLTAAPEVDKEADAYKNLVAAMQQRIEQAKIEQATIGMTADAAMRYRTEQEAILNLMQAIPKATPEQIEAYRAQARALAEVTSQTQKMKEEQDAAKDMSQFFGQTLEQALMGIAQGGDAAKAALMGLIGALAKAALLGEGPLRGLFQKGGIFGLTDDPAASPATVAQAAARAMARPATPANDNVSRASDLLLSGMGNPLAANDNPATAAEALAAMGGGRFRIPSRVNTNVDPRLLDILRQTAERHGYDAEMISGLRPGDPRYHGKGLAADIQLYRGGKPIPNYQDAGGFRAYEEFAQRARLTQMEMYPELNDKFRFGGYFSGPKGKYGALDSMHFDLSGGPTAGGSWETGLTSQQRAYFPGVESVGMAGAMQKVAPAVTDMTTAVNNATSGLGNFGNGLSNVLSGIGGGGGGGLLGMLGFGGGGGNTGGSIGGLYDTSFGPIAPSPAPVQMLGLQGLPAVAAPAQPPAMGALDLLLSGMGNPLAGAPGAQDGMEKFNQSLTRAPGALDNLTKSTSNASGGMGLFTGVLQMVMQSLGGGGGGGGLLGGLLGAIFGGGAPAGKSGGGYTGTGGKYEPAGIVHRGEYVFSADATRRIGVGALEQMHRSARGYADGGYVGMKTKLESRPTYGAGTGGQKRTVKDRGTFAPVINVYGAGNPQDTAEMVDKKLRAMMEAMAREQEEREENRWRYRA